MTVYLAIVTREAGPGLFKARLDDKFPSNYIQVTSDTWLISALGEAKTISDIVGISDGSTAVGMVAVMGGYFGRAPTNIWDWIRVKLEQASP